MEEYELKIVKDISKNRARFKDLQTRQVFQRDSGEVLMKIPEVKQENLMILYNAVALQDIENVLHEVKLTEEVTILDCELHIL